MSENILYLIIGGCIAIVSGGLSHFISNYFRSKSERRKYVFEKLEDIIQSISILEQDFQLDMAGVLKLRNPEEPTKNLNLTFETNKLECLIRVYHSDLILPYNELKEAINNYHKRKMTIINLERRGEINTKIVNVEYEGLVSDFEYLIKKINLLILSLSTYGNEKIK